MKKIPSIEVPIIENGKANVKNLFQFIENKKVVIFGVPGAFTPTCSEKHLPGFLNLSNQIINKGVDDIFCLSVNDKFVMQSWLLSYPEGNKIKAIADGNADITKALNLVNDMSINYMGLRCSRFAMLVNDNSIKELFIDKPGEFKMSSAEKILSII